VNYLLTKQEYETLLRRAEENEQATVLVVKELMPMRQLEARYANLVIAKCGGNVTKAAKILGLHRHTVTVLSNARTEQTEQPEAAAPSARIGGKPWPDASVNNQKPLRYGHSENRANLPPTGSDAVSKDKQH
jgi:hypothetical protein